MTARRYLVVDDNADLADNLREILKAHGDDAVAVSDPLQALALIQERRFDALITDLQMPGMAGGELVQRARALDPGLPVVVLTAFAADPAMNEVRREGLLGFLPKPLPIEYLLELLDAARRDSVVLLVEDDPTLCDILCELLNGRGLGVVAVGTIAELELVLRTVHPFAALVDLRVPGGVLGEALRSVKGTLGSTPTVVITAYAEEWDSQGLEVLRKPLDTHALVDRLEQLHRQSHPS